jgi:hypothetical protein
VSNWRTDDIPFGIPVEVAVQSDAGLISRRCLCVRGSRAWMTDGGLVGSLLGYRPGRLVWRLINGEGG